MNAANTLIPSGHKSKIPPTLSWPIGAEEISAALADVPQFNELGLNFRFHKSDLLPFQWTWMTLLRVEYRKYDGGFCSSWRSIENGRLDRHWTIVITPVLREERGMLHDKLLPALPEVAAWLVRHNTLQTLGRKSLLVVWDKKKDIVYLSTESALEPERV